jgi:hypothetical protein
MRKSNHKDKEFIEYISGALNRAIKLNHKPNDVLWIMCNWKNNDYDQLIWIDYEKVKTFGIDSKMPWLNELVNIYNIKNKIGGIVVIVFKGLNCTITVAQPPKTLN